MNSCGAGHAPSEITMQSTVFPKVTQPNHRSLSLQLSGERGHQGLKTEDIAILLLLWDHNAQSRLHRNQSLLDNVSRSGYVR